MDYEKKKKKKRWGIVQRLMRTQGNTNKVAITVSQMNWTATRAERDTSCGSEGPQLCGSITCNQTQKRE